MKLNAKLGLANLVPNFLRSNSNSLEVNDDVEGSGVRSGFNWDGTAVESGEHLSVHTVDLAFGLGGETFRQIAICLKKCLKIQKMSAKMSANLKNV